MESEISASFTLTGVDFEPEKITAKVGIIPTKIWKVGDLINPKAIVRRKHNGWSIKSKLQNLNNINDHIKSVFEQLQPGWLPLIDICKRHFTEINCVIYVKGDERPAIHFDKDIVDKAATVNA